VSAGCKPSGAPDLGLLVGGGGTTAAGVFTTNRAPAVPVRLAREGLASGWPRAVLVNSGQANAATGPCGERDARAMTERAEGLLTLAPGTVLPCSTGVIGEPVHLYPLLGAIPRAVEDLDPEGGPAFARAILTTDTVVKQATVDAGPFRVGGCAKGVGMIAPSLATMLAFLTTDVRVGSDDLRSLTQRVVAPAFEAVSVDGCSSTNDAVLVFASGAAGEEVLRPEDPGWADLAEALERVARSLAEQLIADGEGASTVVLVEVTGAASDDLARVVAKGVANSPLVKTAVFGGDPNPGRLVQAAGAAGVDLDPDAIDVTIGEARVVDRGVIPPAYFEEPSELADAARRSMKDPEVRIRIDVGAGPGRVTMLGCDLSYEYVRINGEYTT
jgi:glutamate N-acetyltransferase/amino-acid N-acetyltransferase